MRVGGRDVVLSYVPSGNYIGEMALLSEAPRSATVKAAHNTETVCIKGDAFKRVLDRNAALKANVEAKFRQRISRMRLNLEPDTIPVGGRPDGLHLGSGVTRNHRCLSRPVGRPARPPR